jgi:tetratricopeptide (TPR) repeat protein
MDFYAVLDQAVDLLRQRGRVTYRALKLQFKLDDDQLAALKDELLYAHPQVVDDAGRGLRWTGTPAAAPPAAAPALAQDLAPLSYTPTHLAERLSDPQRLGRIVSSLCFSFSIMGEHERAIAAGQRALALATTSGTFDVQVNAQNNLIVAYYAAGDHRQALDVAQRVMALLTGELLYERFGLPILPGLLSRSYAATYLAELGSFAEGTGIGEEAVRLAEAVAHPVSIVVALYLVGLAYRRQGVLHKAVPMLERSLAVCQSADLPMQFPLGASFLSGTYALAGRVAEALPLLDQMLERVAAGSRMLLHALVLTELSEACLLVGRVDEASALAGRLLELSRTHTGHSYQAHAYRLLGEVTRRREPLDVDQATVHYHQAWL